MYHHFGFDEKYFKDYQRGLFMTTNNKTYFSPNLLHFNPQNGIIIKSRTGLVDIWNSYMLEDADFTSHSNHDIPFCPTTATILPKDIIRWSEAELKYRTAIENGESTFFYDAFVCYCVDDYRFDNCKTDKKRNIWLYPEYSLEVLKHFAGAFSPDFSTYQDFPEPIKIYNTYRMRMFGYWWGKNGIAVINNTRWGTSETYEYCYDGLPDNDILFIGTVGGSPRRLEDRQRFEEGLFELIRRCHPHTLIVYGSTNYPCFDVIKEQGVRIVPYKSHTALAFEGRRSL